MPAPSMRRPVERHPNNLVHAMNMLGFGPGDVLQAYPGYDEAMLRQLWLDVALSQDRPVCPYGLLGIKPCRSRFFNFSEHGFRRNSPREQPWPPDGDAHTIFCMGSSITLGFNVADEDAVPALLEAELCRRGHRVRCYNFGQNSYTARHEAMCLLNLLDNGARPDIALFFDGYNDCYYAFGNPGLIRRLDALYGEDKRRRSMPFRRAVWDFAKEAWRTRRQPLPDNFSWMLPPAYAEFSWYFTEEGIDDALVASSAQPVRPLEAKAAEMVWRRYLDTVALLDGMSHRHGFIPLYAWQPAATHGVRPDQRLMSSMFHIFKNGALCGPFYRAMSRAGFPEMAGRRDFRDFSLMAEAFDGIAFVDTCHFSPAFARTVAIALADFVEPHLHVVPQQRVQDSPTHSRWQLLPT